MLGLAPRYNARNPFSFMELQDVQELTNFFERRVSAYQVGVKARSVSMPPSSEQVCPGARPSGC